VSTNGTLLNATKHTTCIATGASAVPTTQELTLELSAAELAARPHPPRPADAWGSGQGLFALFRRNAALAEEGASPLLSSIPS
jgi:hypothetical protein